MTSQRTASWLTAILVVCVSGTLATQPTPTFTGPNPHTCCACEGCADSVTVIDSPWEWAINVETGWVAGLSALISLARSRAYGGQISGTLGPGYGDNIGLPLVMWRERVGVHETAIGDVLCEGGCVHEIHP